jgi:hypothetical protein
VCRFRGIGYSLFERSGCVRKNHVCERSVLCGVAGFMCQARNMSDNGCSCMEQVKYTCACGQFTGLGFRCGNDSFVTK